MLILFCYSCSGLSGTPVAAHKKVPSLFVPLDKGEGMQTKQTNLSHERYIQYTSYQSMACMGIYTLRLSAGALPETERVDVVMETPPVSAWLRYFMNMRTWAKTLVARK